MYLSADVLPIPTTSFNDLPRKPYRFQQFVVDVWDQTEQDFVELGRYNQAQILANLCDPVEDTLRRHTGGYCPVLTEIGCYVVYQALLDFLSLYRESSTARD